MTRSCGRRFLLPLLASAALSCAHPDVSKEAEPQGVDVPLAPLRYIPHVPSLESLRSGEKSTWDCRENVDRHQYVQELEQYIRELEQYFAQLRRNLPLIHRRIKDSLADLEREKSELREGDARLPAKDRIDSLVYHPEVGNPEGSQPAYLEVRYQDGRRVLGSIEGVCATGDEKP